MSLKARLSLSIFALVLTVVTALSAAMLVAMGSAWFVDAQERASMIALEVQSILAQRVKEQASQKPGLPLEQLIAEDAELPRLLGETLATSRVILAILVTDARERVLASSDPSLAGRQAPAYERLERWDRLPLWEKMGDIFGRGRDYQLDLGVSAGETAAPTFRIKVAVSSVLLRHTMQSEMARLGLRLAFLLAASLVLAALVARWAFRPLDRISRAIDQITGGKVAPDSERARREPAEVAAVHSKLDLLGQQYRGAREDTQRLRGRIEQLMERIDIATRLSAINRLTGGVAHEIKNPLNAITLHLEVLKAKLGSDAEPVAPEIEIISREMARLDRVVKTFLDFNRPVELRLTDIDLRSIAREVAALVEPQAESQGVGMDLDTGESPAWVRGDHDLLKQAVVNVVANGIEAMKEGGRLRIAAGRSDDACWLSVADQGVGIPEEARDKIFNLYFSTKEKGTGIGLAVTFRVVQLHGGIIHLTSETGKGTTFVLRFPPVEGA